MSRLEAATEIEDLVGAPRQVHEHLGRANSQLQRVFILHSYECLVSGIDLRNCPYAIASDRGINVVDWIQDQAVVLRIHRGHLIGDTTYQGTPRNLTTAVADEDPFPEH